MISMQQLEALLPRIDALLRHLEDQRLPLDDRLWDTGAIAEWLNLSVDTVTRAVVTRPGFPQPVQAVSGALARRRWFAGEVVRWARQNRGRLPVRRGARRRQATES